MRALGLVERPKVGATASALRWVDVPQPSPAKGQVRVRVVAAALNIDDVHTCAPVMGSHTDDKAHQHAEAAPQ